MHAWKPRAVALALATGASWFTLSGHGPQIAADTTGSISPLDMTTQGALGTAEDGHAF
jgi:hypothetical protein